jgi:putative ABC transport system permease protein
MFHSTIWRLGFKSLTLHPMRSLLTILGIFIGIASVIWLLAIGEGISERVRMQIEELGTNNVILRSTLPPTESSADVNSRMAIYGITRADYSELMTTIPTIDKALRIRDAHRELYYGSVDASVHCIGCTPEYDEVMGLRKKDGRFLEARDLEKDDNVCVLSHELAQAVKPIGSAVGAIIKIRETPFRVVGVMEKRSAMAAIGGSFEAQDFSDDVYIPLTTFWRRIGDWTMERSQGTQRNEVVEISQITFRVDDTENVIATSKAIESIMNRRHDQQDWKLIIPLELLEQARTTRLMFMAFMGLIAAISLVVGGIGIMNIMLATVTERTREIGIRRALGANRRDIVKQFLAETVVLSAVGGVTGIFGGLLCPWIVVWVRDFIRISFPEAVANLPPSVMDFRPMIVTASIPLAFTIAVVVGVVFGIYPAVRAAKLDPIEALRHE